jgi:hypothetical protein
MIITGSIKVASRYFPEAEVKEYEMGRECSTHLEKENADRVLVGKPEGK